MQTSTSSNQVLTVKEVADYYRLREKTVYALASKGEIPGAFRIGGSLRFRRDEIVKGEQR